MTMEPGRDTTTASTPYAVGDQQATDSRRAGRTLAWVIGVIVLGALLAAAAVVVVAVLLVVRAGDPSDLGPSPVPAGGGALADATRCRAEQPVSMQIDFAAPAETLEGAEATAKDQVGEAYAVANWKLIETGPDGSSWYGVSADASVVAVFDIDGVGSGWMIGDIRRC